MGADGMANPVDPDVGLHCLPRPVCPKTSDHYGISFVLYKTTCIYLTAILLMSEFCHRGLLDLNKMIKNCLSNVWEELWSTLNKKYIKDIYEIKILIIYRFSSFCSPVTSRNKLSSLMSKPTKWLCAQQRLRSAWASAQSDQSLRCALNG